MEQEQEERWKAQLSHDTRAKQHLARFQMHLEHQEDRLQCIAKLLGLSPGDARILIELMIEWLRSEGIINPKMVRKLDKKFGGEE